MARATVGLLLLLAAAGCGEGPAPAPTARLAIRATGPDGAPLPYVLVTLTGEEGTPVRALYDERVDLDGEGRGVVAGCPVGPASLRLSTIRQFRSGEGYDLVHVARIRLAAPVLVHEAVLRPGGRMRVGMTDEEGRGVPARLFVVDAGGAPVAATFWRGDDGGWTTEQFPLSPPFVSCVLPPGRYRVEARRYRETVASGDTEVLAGEVSDLPLIAEHAR